MQKFISAITGFEGNSLLNSSLKCQISEIFIQDLKASFEEVKEVFNFNGMVAY